MKKFININTVGTAILAAVVITVVLCFTVFNNGTYIANITIR